VINEYGEEQLKMLFYDYADLKNAPKLASLIVEARKEKPIESSEQLNDLLKPHLFKGKENKILAQIYQAIRIEVNQEIEALKEFLKQTEELVVKNGRISLISYHSLEDRLVKRYIRSGLFEGEPEKDFYGNISVPFKKVGGLIVPSAEEIKENNRARSAKLRVAKKL
jgi:16S rRNA (cytosine1402-N4)-methyltransferase